MTGVTDFPDWARATVVFPSADIAVVQDFPDWTDGVIQITGSVSLTQDFPDWTKTTEVDTSIPIQAPNTGQSAARIGGSYTLNVPAPTGMAVGDLMVATCAVWVSSPTGISSPGWTVDYLAPNTDPNGTMAVLTKTAGSSEPASYTFTVTTTGALPGLFTCAINTYRGPTGLDGTPGYQFENSSTETVFTAASVTPTQTGDTFLLVYFAAGTNGGATFTTPAGMFERAHTNNLGAYVEISFDQALSTTNPTGAVKTTTTDPGDYMALSILLH